MSITSELKRKRGNQPTVIVRVKARDKHCRWRGCRVTDPVHVHHIVEKANGGTDDMDNLILYCKEHHAMAHNRINDWSKLNLRNVSATMSAKETKAQLIKDNPSYRKQIEAKTPENVRKYWWKQMNGTPKTVNVAPARVARIAEILSNMDAQKAANILNCF